MRIDVSEIIKHGKEISTQEALSDVTPIEWGKEVLDGVHRDRVLVRVYDNNGFNSKITGINVEKILKNGKEISTQEALSGVTPIEWSKDVLDGVYRDQVIASLSSQESLDVQGPVLIKRKF